MNEAPEVAIGQVWLDGAIQAQRRYIIVVGISDAIGRATCLSSSTNTTTSISLDRFNNDVHGYFYIGDVWTMVDRKD